MILIEAGPRTEQAFDAKTIMATHLAGRGHSVAIDAATRPDEMDRGHRYQVAPFLFDRPDITITQVLLIGAEALSQETLQTLSGYNLDPSVPVTALGRFTDHQTLIGARARIAYVLGREPVVRDLADLQPKPILPGSILPVMATEHRAVSRSRPDMFLSIPAEFLDDPAVLQTLAAMNHLPGFRLNLILPGKTVDPLPGGALGHLRAYGSTELSPATFATMADIGVFLGEAIADDRMAAMATDLMRSARPVIDGTAAATLAAAGAPALRGPTDLSAIANFLTYTVLPNLQEIGRQTKSHPWLAAYSVEQLERAIGLPSPKAATHKSAAAASQVFFVPTNGVGLGHAQRCIQIALDMKNRDQCSFASHPSCIPLIEAQGLACLPLVPKSPYHREEYANDLVNHLRLRRAVPEESTLVFDGGYVFDSIYRTILERSLTGIWIRRGLWQPGQIHRAALEREKVFSRVIVPDEAFDELNTDYTFGRHIHHVGPILRRTPADKKTRKMLRKNLAARFDHPCGELVVTMLGGGVAADRAAQTQTLCNIADQRPGCLHLVVVWPGASVPAGLYGWKNSRVVRTRNTLALCQASDLVISAAGYNAFHEILYHGIPAILMPQTASFMDDQERRARAAADRGLAETVLAHELLLLEREVRAFLDEGKSRRIRAALAEFALPEPGNRAAARLIEGGLTDAG